MLRVLGGSLQVVIGVLGLLLWDRFAVVMRASTMQVRRREYVAAAQVIGASTPRILLSEIMPNIANNLIVVVTLEMAHAILLEAALSFLGLGVQPPTPSWGLMVSEGKNMMLFEPWLVLIPGAVLFVLVLAKTTLAFVCVGTSLYSVVQVGFLGDGPATWINRREPIRNMEQPIDVALIYPPWAVLDDSAILQNSLPLVLLHIPSP